MQNKIEPLSHRRKIGALKLVERVKRRSDFWTTYSPAVHRHLNLAGFNLDLDLPVSKKNCLETELKIVTLTIIGERFPEQHWLHRYVIGSITGAHTNVAPGVYTRLLSLSRAIGKGSPKIIERFEAAEILNILPERGRKQEDNSRVEDIVTAAADQPQSIQYLQLLSSQFAIWKRKIVDCMK
ncbi:hypothetical protein NPIL_633751 [Nephila pilipes]|uniref:Uncharacterized protein n=1 Tax=Nephila pilipes TaxID=299642 RepID=A0A8X6P8W4_NEPPI|nr:hypothetical protein NPIL_633751 [Nephila pilipes]